MSNFFISLKDYLDYHTKFSGCSIRFLHFAWLKVYHRPTQCEFQSQFNCGLWLSHMWGSSQDSTLDFDHHTVWTPTMVQLWIETNKQCELQPWFRHGLWPSQGELQPWLSCGSSRSHTVCSSHSLAVYCDHHTVWAPVIAQLWILSMFTSYYAGT